MSITHQNVRKISEAIFTPILLIPELIILISPILVLFLPKLNYKSVLLFINAAIILWLIATLISLFLGRVYCSHICPITGLFSFISYVKKDRNILSIEYPKIVGIVTLLLWTFAPLYVILRNAGNYTGLLQREVIYSELSVNLYYVLFAISGILSYTYGKISIKHYICPFSSFMISASRLSRKFGIPVLQFNYNKNLCKRCGECAKKCLVNRDIPKLIYSDSISFDECVQCGYCAEKCQNAAITYGWKKGK